MRGHCPICRKANGVHSMGCQNRSYVEREIAYALEQERKKKPKRGRLKKEVLDPPAGKEEVVLKDWRDEVQ